MQQKYKLGTRLTYFWHKTENEISLNFIFVFEPLRFRHACLSFLLSKFTSQIKLIQSVVGGQLLVSWSQSPISRVSGVRISCPRVASPKSQVPRVPGHRVPGSQVPGSQVLGHGSSGTSVFLWIFTKFLRTSFVQNTSGWLLLMIAILYLVKTLLQNHDASYCMSINWSFEYCHCWIIQDTQASSYSLN